MDNPKLNTIPLESGVYLFKDAENTIIYIGKAKSLKKRVQSYFQKKDDDWKIQALIDEHATIEHVITKTETEALLLEAELIKKHQPKYNVLLKSGQPFVYLLFTQEKEPKLELVRNKQKKGVFFGPFLHKNHARGVYDYLLKTFQLEWCNKKISGGCLRYHIDLCAGNCKDDFDLDCYLFRLNLAMGLLKGHYKQSIKELEAQIHYYSTNLEFEKAQHLHTYLQNLETIFNTLKARYSSKKYEYDVFLATSPVYKRTKPDLTLAAKIQEFLKTEKPISSIDCFDISHFQGTTIVGSCVRFIDGIPEKSKFRKFNIKTLKNQDDYAALQEIVARRYRNDDLPNLIIIDGGKGQLNAVKHLTRETPTISLAKREERIFSSHFPDGILLDQKSTVGLLFITIRDYAHHFAISHHRSSRSKKVIE